MRFADALEQRRDRRLEFRELDMGQCRGEFSRELICVLTPLFDAGRYDRVHVSVPVRVPAGRRDGEPASVRPSPR